MNKIFNCKEDFIKFIDIYLEHYLPTRIKHLLIRHTDEIGLMVNYRYNNINYFLKFPFTFEEFKDVVFHKHICQMKQMGEWGERKLKEALDKYLNDCLNGEKKLDFVEHIWSFLIIILKGCFFIDSNGEINFADPSVIDFNFYYKVLKIKDLTFKFEDENKTWSFNKEALKKNEKTTRG